MKSAILTAIALLTIVFSFAQKGEGSLGKGNEYYRQSQYDLAERQYKLTLQEDPDNATAQYNLANALYQQKKYKEATDVLKKLQKGTSDNAIKQASFYNEGVVHTKEKDLQASIEAYKAALRLKPDDQQARENLQKAIRELKKQQEEKKKQQQQKQPQSNMSQKEAEQKLKLLQEKEKQLQQRLQQKGQKGNALPKDW